MRQGWPGKRARVSGPSPAAGAERAALAREWGVRLDHEVATYRALRDRAQRWGIAAAVPLVAALAVYQAHLGYAGTVCALALLAASIAALRPAVTHAGQMAEARQLVAGTLAAARSPCTVGCLAMHCRDRDPDWALAATRGLARLLPHVSSEDAAAIDGAGMRALGRLLRGSDREMTLAVLGALRRVGDATVLPDVRRLALPPDTLDVYSRQANVAPEVRAAAHASLVWIEARAARQEPHSRLLRPAQGPGVTDLLRPARPTGARPEELLRAADGNPAGDAPR